MKIKHKLLSDYQYVSPDKKIFLIKSGTIIDNYVYKYREGSMTLDKELVEANPQLFSPVDWKSELISHLKSEKIPQPSIVGKKIIPFFEEMIISSLNEPHNNNLDPYQIKELETKEKDLQNRELRIKSKEEELEIRISRVEKRENSYKEDLKSLDKKEDELREKNRLLSEKQVDLEDKIQDLNERERNLDRNILKSSDEIESKYSELRKKIDSDLESVSIREKDLEVLTKELKRQQSKLEKKESQISDRLRDFEIKLEEFKIREDENKRLEQEIKDWENLHWKFKRNYKPPSAI